MSDLADIERRLARVEARHAISDLVTAYAQACDEHDMPALLDLFTADAVFTSPSGLMQAAGHAAIGAMFVDLFKVRGPAFHWTHDHIIRPDPADDDRATGRIFSHAETSPGGVVSLAAMRYDDEYRREAGRWRFARRSIAFLYYVPAESYPTSLASPLRLHAGGKRLPADYPEGLAAWEDFARNHLTPAAPSAATKGNTHAKP